MNPAVSGRSLAALVAAVVLTSSGVAHAQNDRPVPYTGELIDEAGVPISGVFPLEFSLFEAEGSRTAFWTESRHVAVYEGAYEVDLGTLSPIPGDRVGSDAFIAVSIGDIGEVTRHGITLTPRATPQTRDEVIAELDITFADLAERSLFAVEATSAGDCRRVGGKTLEELDRYDEVLTEMASLRDRLDEVTGARLGSRTTTLERIGGAGGNPYSRTCPPGHVVTGARGGAGALIDSIEFICSPLQ